MAKGKVLRNSSVALVTNLIVVVLGFGFQRQLADSLGPANLGLNSVMTSLVSILSLADMGITTAIVFHLYAPLAVHDTVRLHALMKLYARVFRGIALAVTLLGLCMVPFLPMLLKDASFDRSYVYLVFGLFLLRSVSSYLLSWPRSLIMADQRTHIVSLVDLGMQVLNLGGGLLLLRLTSSLPAYLGWAAMCTILGNVTLLIICRRLYPWLREKVQMNGASVPDFFKDVKDVFLMRLSGVILTSTDSVIISSFVSVIAAGCYDNYSRISQALLTLVSAVMNAVTPTLGNLFARKEKQRLEKAFGGCTLVFFLIGSTLGVCTLCLATPFVTGIWLDRTYELDKVSVALLSFNLFLVTLRSPLWSATTVCGLFKWDKHASALGALSNLVISLVLVWPLGLPGVLIGTMVSQSLQVVLKGRLLYKRGLEMPQSRFFGEIAMYLLLFLCECAGGYALTRLFTLRSPILDFLVKGAGLAVLTLGLGLLIFCRTGRFRDALSLLKTGKEAETP